MAPMSSPQKAAIQMLPAAIIPQPQFPQSATFKAGSSFYCMWLHRLTDRPGRSVPPWSRHGSSMRLKIAADIGRIYWSTYGFGDGRWPGIPVGRTGYGAAGRTACHRPSGERRGAAPIAEWPLATASGYDDGLAEGV